MAVLETTDQLGQLWALIQELSEQLNQNRSLSVSLHAQAGNIKSQAVHSQTGFVLRRFNLDKTQEEYEAELDRMNNSMLAENQALQRDNKQLNALIKDYEQTLDSLMSKFRNRARDVQERELSLIRDFETKLLTQQDEYATQDLASNNTLSGSLTRISRLLRQVLRSIGGENPESPLIELDEEETNDNEIRPYATSSTAPSTQGLDRETELVRLEIENEELRRLLAFGEVHQSQRSTLELQLPSEQPRIQDSHQEAGFQSIDTYPPSVVGPFGTYKRPRPQP